MELNNILSFQIQRKIMFLCKDTLSLLEEKHEYIQTLEKLLLDMGIEKYKESAQNYNKDRAKILGNSNDAIRELQGQLDLFDIKLRK